MENAENQFLCACNKFIYITHNFMKHICFIKMKLMLRKAKKKRNFPLLVRTAIFISLLLVSYSTL